MDKIAPSDSANAISGFIFYSNVINNATNGSGGGIGIIYINLQANLSIYFQFHPGSVVRETGFTSGSTLCL